MAYQPTVVKQIGRNGLLIETRSPLQPDSRHELRLDLAGFTIEVTGRIVHCRLSEITGDHIAYLAGIELVEPSEHARLVIETYLREHHPSRKHRADPPGHGLTDSS